MVQGPFHPRFEDLPSTLAIFPLQGAVLLPWGKLPLNIFEPRYLNMIEDALGNGRMIGMIQPRKARREPGEDPVPLYDVGCAGRISSFSETSDGRILITLTGVIRFSIATEYAMSDRGYRTVLPNWEPFIEDLTVPPPISLDRKRLMLTMGSLVHQRELPMNLRILDELKEPDLVTTLAMICPFEVQEKQAILEAKTLQERANLLQTLLEMATYSGGGEPQARQ